MFNLLPFLVHSRSHHIAVTERSLQELCLVL